MYNNDYIIAVDENGQPYIAHAFGDKAKAAWGSIKGTATKYKDKIPLGNGKFRYVYDIAKKAGKKAWGSKAGRWIDSHDAGITERLMAKRASRLTKKYAKKGDKAAAKYYAGRSMALNQESAKERAAAKESIKRRGRSALKYLDDHDAGLTEGVRYLKAKRKGVNSTEDLQDLQRRRYDWEHTWLGKRTKRKKKSSNSAAYSGSTYANNNNKK